MAASLSRQQSCGVTKSISSTVGNWAGKQADNETATLSFYIEKVVAKQCRVILDILNVCAQSFQWRIEFASSVDVRVPNGVASLIGSAVTSVPLRADYSKDTVPSEGVKHG